MLNRTRMSQTSDLSSFIIRETIFGTFMSGCEVASINSLKLASGKASGKRQMSYREKHIKLLDVWDPSVIENILNIIYYLLLSKVAVGHELYPSL